jgi:hypothetical protein
LEKIELLFYNYFICKIIEFIIKMEKRLNKKIETYVSEFKDSIKNKIAELNFDEKPKINELLEYVYEYSRLTFEKDDFVKRKRIKNSIPNMNRCNARRANGEQCTRRRKDGCDFCGTHFKGAQYGLITNEENIENNKQKIEVYTEDVNGIIYYFDKFSNVYNTEDILEGKQNPRIIAKYTKVNDLYTISDFL